MKHILIIEDEMLIAMHLEALVGAIEGVSVDIASHHGEAVDLARSRPPVLIISDVRLAEGTGPAAVAAIGKISARCR